MKARAAIVTLFFVGLTCASTLPESKSLLNETYRLNSALGPAGSEQLYHMIEVARVSTKAGISPQQGKQICLALFDMASKEKDLRRRIIGQKGAVRYLSFFEPALAMNMLREISLQHPDPGQPLYEDYRYNAAQDVFVNYLARLKPQGLSTVIDTARYLGDTGQYPYHAMADVISALPSSLKNQTNDILSDALGYYVRETGYRNRDEEFLLLLTSLLRNSDADKELVSQALRAYVQRLRSEPNEIPGQYYSEIYTSDGQHVSFADRNQAFLFQVFPVIRKFNPELAAQLATDHPGLKIASGSMQYISGGFVDGKATIEQANEQHTIWLEQSLVERVKKRAACDINSASQLAQQISTPSSRVVGFSAMVPVIAIHDQAAARQLYGEQLEQLHSLQTSEEKLHAQVALSVAGDSIGDSLRTRSMKQGAFESGLSLVTEEMQKSPKERIQNLESFNELKDLVSSSSSADFDSRIQDMPDSWLKAYLLLYEAEAATKTSASTATKCSD